MTRLLDEAFETVKAKPAALQDLIAQTMLDMAEGTEQQIEVDHLSAVLEGLAQIERGEFADDQEVISAFRRFER